MEKHNNAVEAYCQDKICCCQDIKHCFNFMFRWQIARPAPCKRVAKGRGGGGERGPDPVSCTNFKTIHVSCALNST